MKKIIKLDNKTIENIAAGEIINRPVSIIKELVENSIDAGATDIVVEIKRGGKDYIRVTDNGSGIFDEKLQTSKICFHSIQEDSGGRH